MEYTRRNGEHFVRPVYHIVYTKPPKRLETYLQDNHTVFVANGKAYETLEEAETWNDLGMIYKRVNGSMAQPVYIPVYERINYES